MDSTELGASSSASYTFEDFDGDSAPSFSIGFDDNGDDSQLSINFASLSTLSNLVRETLELDFDASGVTPFILGSCPDSAGGSNPVIASSNPPYDWMHKTFDRIQCLTLRELCMPGTHDSGMSEFIGGSGGALAGDAQTQNLDIGGQLQNGARWFDIRPVIAGGNFVTGHYSCVTVIESFWAGGNGQAISDIIDEINAFTSSNQELIILGLSHGVDTDNFSGDQDNHLTQDNWNDFMNELLSIEHRVTEMSDVSDISQLTVSALIQSSAAVFIVVRDSVEGGGDVDLGDFADQGFFTSDQYPAYNSYANSDDDSTVISDQISKMVETRTSPDSESFQLSWAFTESTGDIIGGVLGGASLIDNATSLNNEIRANLPPNTTTSTYSNVIEIDAYPAGTRPFAALAMAINYWLAPTCTSSSASASSVRSVSAAASGSVFASASSSAPVGSSGFSTVATSSAASSAVPSASSSA